MSSLKYIPVEHLQVGMYVTDQTPGLNSSQFRGQGFIRRAETIEKLQAGNIKHVFIDTKKGPDSPFALPVQVEEIVLTPVVSLEEERERAGKIYGEALGMVNNLHQQIKLGKAIQKAPLEELANDISQSMNNNHNAMLCLSQLREKDRYLLEHSINCGILFGLFARHLGYDSDTVNDLVTAGMLLDCGKVRVDDSLLTQPTRLTAQQWPQMKKHVEAGVQLLREAGNISDEVIMACGQHHERLDGSGYPLGLDHRSVGVYGRMAAIVDSYDAMTADRLYRPSVSPSDAMRELSTLAGRTLDEQLTYRFIRCMGVYPVGTLVELDNGRVGVVLETNPGKPDKPVIRVFYNSRHRHQETPKVVNLASPRIEHKIVATLSRDELGIPINDFL